MQRRHVLTLSLVAAAIAVAAYVAVRAPAGAGSAVRSSAPAVDARESDARPPAERLRSSDADAPRAAAAPSASLPPADVAARAPEDARGAARSERFDRATRAWLSDTPPLADLEALIAELGSAASVDEASVARDPDTKALSGRLVIPGFDGRVEFEIDGDDVEVSVSGALPGDPRFSTRGLSLRMQRDGLRARSANAVVQFHPDTQRSAAQVLGGERVRVGWGVTVDGERTTLVPMFAEATSDGRGWQIGRLGGEPANVVLEGATQRDPYDPWLRALANYR